MRRTVKALEADDVEAVEREAHDAGQAVDDV